MPNRTDIRPIMHSVNFTRNFILHLQPVPHLIHSL